MTSPRPTICFILGLQLRVGVSILKICVTCFSSFLSGLPQFLLHPLISVDPVLEDPTNESSNQSYDDLPALSLMPSSGGKFLQITA